MFSISPRIFKLIQNSMITKFDFFLNSYLCKKFAIFLILFILRECCLLYISLFIFLVKKIDFFNLVLHAPQYFSEPHTTEVKCTIKSFRKLTACFSPYCCENVFGMVRMYAGEEFGLVFQINVFVIYTTWLVIWAGVCRLCWFLESTT